MFVFFSLVWSWSAWERELYAYIFSDNEIIVSARAWRNLRLVDLSLGLSGLYLCYGTCRSSDIDFIYHALIYNKRSGWEKQCFRLVCVTSCRSFTIRENDQEKRYIRTFILNEVQRRIHKTFKLNSFYFQIFHCNFQHLPLKHHYVSFFHNFISLKFSCNLKISENYRKYISFVGTRRYHAESCVKRSR